jgi:hypothetical protein
MRRNQKAVTAPDYIRLVTAFVSERSIGEKITH